MVQTRSKSGLSKHDAETKPNVDNDNIRKQSITESNNSKSAVLPPTICTIQQQQKTEQNSLQLEDINSIPDPPTPPNPSTLQKYVAVAVANAKRRRDSAAARRLSGNCNEGPNTPLSTFRQSINSNCVPRESPPIIHNEKLLDQVVFPKNAVDLDCSNDSDMSIDVSNDQIPQPSSESNENEPKETANTPSICFDDSSDDLEENNDKENFQKKRRRQSMFHKKNQECLDGSSTMDEKSVEEGYLKAKMGKKRSRRSIFLPGEERYEVCAGSSFNTSGPMQVPRRGRRSMLLPSDGNDDLNCKRKERFDNGNHQCQNQIDSRSLLPDENSNMFGKNLSTSSSNSGMNTSAAVTAAFTNGNIVNDEQLTVNLSTSSTSNPRKLHGKQEQKGYTQGQQQLLTQKTLPLQKERLNQMKITVRKFCSFPLKDRCKSKDADILHIRETIGYPIISEMDKLRYQNEKMGSNNKNGDSSSVSALDLDWTSSPRGNQPAKDGGNTIDQNDSSTKTKEEGGGEDFVITDEMKKNVLMKMCPVVSRMEAKRKDEVALVEAFTGCRVERKRGKFKYISLSTGKKVPSSKYQILYFEMIKKRRLELQEGRKDGNNVATNPVTVPQKSNKGVIGTNESRLKLNHVNKTNIRSSIAVDTSCDEVKNKDSESQCVPEEDVECSLPILYSAKSNAVREETVKVAEQLDDDATLPSRESLSADPEIATLQSTLFSTIDIALQTYSDHVLKLCEKRRRERQVIMNV